MSAILEPIVTGSTDGTQLLCQCDWQADFSSFKSLPNMKKFHVIKFSCYKPGIATCQEHSEAEVAELKTKICT